MQKEQKVKLLILTQKVDINDPILGFFHRWIEEFAKHCEQVTVICLEEGKHNFYSAKNAVPRSENSEEFSGTGVRVFSLGKEKVKSQKSKVKSLKKLKYTFNFCKIIWCERKNYDAVFVHMNPIYVIFGGLLWKVWRKKIGLWYTHKNVDTKLRIAEKLVDIIFTASSESFRYIHTKVRVVGHGIDVLKFAPATRLSSDVSTTVSVGRFSSTKKQHEMVEAFNILRDRGFNGRLVLIGGPVTSADILYEKKVKDYIKDKKLEERVLCVGPVSPEIAASWYKKADMFVNLSETGSMDKAVLEAMASGLQVVVSNEAFKNILPEYNFIHKSKNEVEEIVSKITTLSKQTADHKMREYVTKNHNLSGLFLKIIEIMKQ